MKYGTCCLKALKHGEGYCPVCGQYLIPFNPTTQLKSNFKEKEQR